MSEVAEKIDKKHEEAGYRSISKYASLFGLTESQARSQAYSAFQNGALVFKEADHYDVENSKERVGQESIKVCELFCVTKRDTAIRILQNEPLDKIYFVHLDPSLFHKASRHKSINPTKAKKLGPSNPRKMRPERLDRKDLAVNCIKRYYKWEKDPKCFAKYLNTNGKFYIARTANLLKTKYSKNDKEIENIPIKKLERAIRDADKAGWLEDYK